MGRLRSCQRGGPLALAAILALTVASTVVAGSPAVGNERRAQLDGRAIALADVARFQCHDRDFPVIRCFTSAAERDRDMVAIGLSAELVSATHYVTWYDGANYPEPPSFAAYWSEPDLTIYGWNDKISSFRTYNGGHPRWWQDVGNKGSAWDWGALPKAYVGDAANDQFSGVERLGRTPVRAYDRSCIGCLASMPVEPRFEAGLLNLTQDSGRRRCSLGECWMERR